MSTEILTINSLELASELAHQKLINEWSESIKIYEDEEAEELIYSNEAQDIFNGLYDDYLTLITKCTVELNPKLVKCDNCDEIVEMVSTGEFCPSCLH